MKILITVVCSILLYVGIEANATTFYVSRVTGDDTRSSATAQNSATPWKNVRGMPCATSNAAAYTPVPGDRFIFKGGETWPAACFLWNPQPSGSAGNIIYYGNDDTYGTGRPILDAESTVLSTHNCFIWSDGSYVQFDNFEVIRLHPSTAIFGEDCVINPRSANNFIISRFYVHQWDETVGQDSGSFVASNSVYPSIHTNAIMEKNVIDGSDTARVIADPNCTGACTGSLAMITPGGSMPVVRYNVCRFTTQCVVGSVDRFYGNLVEHMRFSVSGGHPNAFENNGACGAQIYNNLIRHSYSAVILWIAERSGCTAYAFNNVVADPNDTNILDFARPTIWGGCSPNDGQYCDAAGTVIFVNNTVQCGKNDVVGNVQCGTVPFGVTVVARNNHLITTHGTPIGTAVGGTLTYTNNTVQSQAAANTQGYTNAQTYQFSPTDAGDATVSDGNGVNLTATYCGIVPDLCSDSAVGALYNSSTHTSTYPNRTVVPRSPSLAWNTGAYQLSGVTNLRVMSGGIRASGMIRVQ